MNNSSVSGNWEELFDSGQLDRQLQQLKPFHSSNNSNSSPTIITVQGSSSNSSGNTGGVVMSGVGDPKSLYRSPPVAQTTEPKLKILKRPSSSPNFQNQQHHQTSPQALLLQQTPQNQQQTSNSNPSMNSEQLSRHKKSLKQREEEYAMARLRILGSSGTSPPEMPDFSVPPPPLPAKFVQQYRSADNSVVRPPKGPDGSRGFQK